MQDTEQWKEGFQGMCKLEVPARHKASRHKEFAEMYLQLRKNKKLSSSLGFEDLPARKNSAKTRKRRKQTLCGSENFVREKVRDQEAKCRRHKSFAIGQDRPDARRGDTTKII